MEKFCIATLTHDGPGRDKYLKLTIDTLLENTNVTNLEWFIHCNGTSESVYSVVNEAKERYKNLVTFHFSVDVTNRGVGAGINKLNEYTTDYKYTLFLEGDWITLPLSISGHDKNWLNNCLSYLENNDHIDQVALRRYLHDVDDRQYGYGHWIKKDNIKQINHPFIDLVAKDYTNNPHIRRNSKYYELGIFPLPEFYDEQGNPTELKDKPMWGQAEIQSERKGHALGSTFMSFGNIVHCDQILRYYLGDNWDELQQKLTKCKFNAPCKYGYLFSHDRFCHFCNNSLGFDDLERHNQQYEKSL